MCVCVCVLRSNWLAFVNEVSVCRNWPESGPSNGHLEVELRAFYPSYRSTRINHFISLLKSFPFIVIVLRYRAHKSVPSSIYPFIWDGVLRIGDSAGSMDWDIFLNFSLLLTCWLAPLLMPVEPER